MPRPRVSRRLKVAWSLPKRRTTMLLYLFSILGLLSILAVNAPIYIVLWFIVHIERGRPRLHYIFSNEWADNFGLVTSAMQVLCGELFILHALARSSTSCLDKLSVCTIFSWHLQIFNIKWWTCKLLFLTFVNSPLRFQSYLLNILKIYAIQNLENIKAEVYCVTLCLLAQITHEREYESWLWASH